jgi:hypothetical protein
LQRQRSGFPRFEFAYREHPTGGLTPPALVSGCERLPAKKRFLRCRNAGHKSAGRQPAYEPNARAAGTVQRLCDRIKSGGRQPAVVSVKGRTCRNASAKSPGTDRRLVSEPRGDDSCVRVRTFPGEKTILAMRERTFTRAPGVSPPWVLGKRTCRSASAKSRETAGGVLANAGAVAVANHGGLTPPALGAERTSAGEKRLLRCTNAHSLERRASARRGTVNRTPWRRNHALCSGYATQNQDRRASARRGCE